MSKNTTYAIEQVKAIIRTETDYPDIIDRAVLGGSLRHEVELIQDRYPYITEAEILRAINHMIIYDET